MKPSGAHTHPEHGGGKGLLLLVAVIVVAVVAGPVAHAVRSFFHVLSVILEIALITIAAGVGVAALLGLTLFVSRFRRQLGQRAPISSRRVIIHPPVQPVQRSAGVPELEQRLARIEGLLLHRNRSIDGAQPDDAVTRDAQAERRS